ncbi:MAG: hypothetical protein CMN30_31335 [Sandaracinus sp.]|nr:hypothetical protein [Sandaracinus sp.]
MTDEELLGTRFCDLPIALEGTWVEEIIAKIGRDLERRDLRLRPHFWLADEWFSPENVPGVAIPFYLAHPRLIRLERKMMFEVEGGTRPECLKLMRHELGHAVQHAFALQRKRRWQQTFGLASKKYPDFYRPRPSSKKFVQHLDGWYAQSHPVEDFAETFAVWLGPRKRWRREYEGWKALEKLEYVDELMGELAGRAPTVRSKAKPYALRTIKETLGEHYDKRRAHFQSGYSDQYDRDLLRVFSDDPDHQAHLGAAAFLRKRRKAIRERVARFTGEYQFTLDQVLKEMIGRCKELKLRLRGSEEEAEIDFALMLTLHTVHTLHVSNEWHPM